MKTLFPIKDFLDESSIFQETVPGEGLDSIGKFLGGVISDIVSWHSRKAVLVSDSEEGVKSAFCRCQSVQQPPGNRASGLAGEPSHG